MKKKVVALSIALIAMMSLAGCYSCGSYHRSKGTGPVAPDVEHKMYWHKDCKPLASIHEPVPAKSTEAKVQTQSCEFTNYGVIRIEKIMPTQIAVNRPFEYKIRAINVSPSDVYEVVITEDLLSDSFEFDSSTPQAKEQGNTLIWKLGTIGANESREITVKGSAVAARKIETCAVVDYIMPSCASIAVVEPMLEVAHTAPKTVVICEPILLTITVSNNGTGMAEDVKIASILPDGLLTTDGKNKVELAVGNLAPGESKEFAVSAIAEKTGSFECAAMATATGLEAKSKKTATVVTKPVLEIAKAGQDKIFLGRSLKYKIEVANSGDAVAIDTIIEDTIPNNVTNVVASQGGQVTGNSVVWELGTLMPDASKAVSISYTPSEAGKFANTATARAVCTDAVSASASSEVAGIPAILLEVIDINDPVEIGSTETYVITVTNQGSATGTNILVKCVLEDTMKYVSSSGATTGTFAKDTVSFAPLPRLAPGDKASWTVVVEAVGAGDVRFTTKMNSDQLDRDVMATEATNFYE